MVDRPILVTGIRVLDLICPLPWGGTLAIRGDEGSGVNVVAMEVMRNLCRRYGAHAAIRFSPTEPFTEPNVRQWLRKLRVEDVVEEMAAGDRGEVVISGAQSIVATLLPFSGHSERVDAWCVLRRSVLDAGRLPAVDLGESSSRLAVTDSDGLAERVKAAVAAGNEELAAYLSQPFFVAEPWTARPGETTEREETVAHVETLLKPRHPVDDRLTDT
jgi:F0F1-type ATP synthase beta subunit